MTELATPQDIARRTSAAVDAAVAAGRDLGIEVTDAKVLYELFSVVVHLAPSPIVARIPTVLPPTTTLDAVSRRQQDELDVAQWLAGQGVPVIAPSTDVPVAPVRRDGFSMTFWPFVAPAGTAPDYVANSEKTAELHAALRSYPGSSSFLSTADPEFVTDGLARLEKMPDLLDSANFDPADLDRARREWQVLEPLVRSQEEFTRRFPGVELQPIHGDSPPANIYHAAVGDLFSDFELITYGPVEWDLAGLAPEHVEAYNRGAAAHGLRALDPDVLAFANAVGMLRAIVCLALVPQLPSLLEHLKPAVEHWRTLPFAGGLSD